MDRPTIPVTGRSLFSSGRLLLAAVVTTFALGLAAGALRAAEGDTALRLLQNSGVHINTIDSEASGRFDTFAAAFIKYARDVTLMWFLAFVPAVAVLAVPVVFVKAYGAGFVGAAMWAAYGEDGLWNAAALFLPQTIIMAYACCRTAWGCLSRAVSAARAAHIMRAARKAADMPEGLMRPAARRIPHGAETGYAGFLVTGLLCAAGTAAVETWVTPMLLALISI